MNAHTSRLTIGFAVLGALCAGCASQRTADIRTNIAPNVDLSSYSTFGFPEQTGTDRGGYSTIITDYFKTAVTEQMQMRGYRFVDENPSLLVNFYANVHERTEVRSRPGGAAAFGYYGYRHGLYDVWPMYAPDVDTVTYPVGTANIDVVDAAKKQLVWEGVAQGRLHDADMDNPREAISSAVTQLFAKFPGRAGAVDSTAH